MSPFGGIKDSGNGIKEGVMEAMKFFTNVKTWSLPWPSLSVELNPGTLVIINLLGGVALLLWGVRMVRTGVMRAWGDRLKHFIEVRLGNRGLGVSCRGAWQRPFWAAARR